VPTPLTAPFVVLDTNVVLDWLLFRHPDGLAVGAALAAGELRWIATAAMRDELAHVLGRGALDRWQPDLPALWADWGRHCAETLAPEPSGPATRFRCIDPDDQKFIDLAVAASPCLLLSYDRAVLKLARRLREAGVDVVTPATWAARRATG
jgi:predicted nucleic acid-binding protein